MRSILRATAVLSASSVVSIAVTVVAVKAYAVILGPTDWGFMGLCMGLLVALRIVAGMGVGEGLVRLGAHAIKERDASRVAALRRSTWILWLLLSGICTLVVILFRTTISRSLLGGPHHGDDVVLIALAIFPALAHDFQCNLLNAHHRVGALARVSMIHVTIGTGVSLALVWRWGVAGIPFAIVAQTMVAWVVSRWFVRREVPEVTSRPGRDVVLRAAVDLLRFGVPYSLSVLACRGVQLLLPVLVLHMLDGGSVGMFRAATMVSLGYLGFLLEAMQKDFYPRVSGAASDRGTLGRLVDDQARLLSLLGTPFIIGTLALTPYLVPIVFSREFLPTVEILEWQLVGDLFRFTSWPLGFLILARGSAATFFFTQLVTGALLLVTSWLGVRWFGLAGMGMASLVTYIAYLGVVWRIGRRYAHLRWTSRHTGLVLLAVAAVAVVRGLPALDLESWRTPLVLVGACALTLNSLVQIRRALGQRRAPAREQIVA